MTLFRSELLPFHPPRHRSRIGAGLARYGRGRSASAMNAETASAHATRINVEPCEPAPDDVLKEVEQRQLTAFLSVMDRDIPMPVNNIVRAA